MIPGNSNTHRLVIIFALVTIALAGCKTSKPDSNTASPSTTASESGVTGVEKVKPSPGTGNVQGKVLFNSNPVENIEVKLCETFNRFLGGCSGQTYTARTDKDGDYVITNVPPKTYEALIAQVFDTDSYVFATSGIGISATKYEVVADKTLFIRPTNLFKGDLKTVNPKAGAKVSAQNLQLKWDGYPDAAYYKFSIFADDSSITSPYINERVDGTLFDITKPMQKGTYRWQVEAFNSDDRKLSESADDMKFTITE